LVELAKHIHKTEHKKLTIFIGKGGGLQDWERTILLPIERANKDCSTRFTNLKVASVRLRSLGFL
jgi:hypothetical protein